MDVGLTACTPLTPGRAEGTPGAAASGALFSPSRIDAQEAEATRFAGALLVPGRYVRAVADHNDLGGVLQELNEADASAQAVTLSLARLLLPGFCFLVDEEETGQQHFIASSGTSAPRRGSRPFEAQLRDKAHEHGEETLSGRRVCWFRLASQRPFLPPDDDRSTTEILRAALASSGRSPASHQHALMRINGIVGGMLSRSERAQTPEQALAVLEHRFCEDDEFADLIAIPEFELYLRRKASGRTSSA